MKKLVALVVLTLIVAFAMVGCQEEPDNPMPPIDCISTTEKET